MQVVTLLGRKGIKREPQLYGIEVEVEAVHNTDWLHFVEGRWQAVQDGSLRNNGMEFITTPCTYKVQMQNLDSYYAAAARYGYRPSIRTGIHVHADMRWRTMEQVAAICALYSAVEPALFSMCGPAREECIYCVPWYRASDDAHLLHEMLTMGDNMEKVHNMLGQTCKYSALYLEPLVRFGTIEFRAAPTFESKEQMVGWLNTIRRLIRLGHAYGTPERVVEALMDDKLVRILQILFPGADPIPLAAEIEECDSIGVATALVRTRQTGEWVFPDEEPLETTRQYHAVAGRRFRELRMDDVFRQDDPEPDYGDDNDDEEEF